MAKVTQNLCVPRLQKNLKKCGFVTLSILFIAKISMGALQKKYSDFLKLRQSFSNGKVSVKKILLKKENDRSDSEKNRAAKWQCVMVALVCPKIAFFGDSSIFSNFEKNCF